MRTKRLVSVKCILQYNRANLVSRIYFEYQKILKNLFSNKQNIIIDLKINDITIYEFVKFNAISSKVNAITANSK